MPKRTLTGKPEEYDRDLCYVGIVMLLVVVWFFGSAFLESLDVSEFAGVADATTIPAYLIRQYQMGQLGTWIFMTGAIMLTFALSWPNGMSLIIWTVGLIGLIGVWYGLQLKSSDHSGLRHAPTYSWYDRM
jgi:hypothetical protein